MKENVRVSLAIVAWIVVLGGFILMGIYGFKREESIDTALDESPLPIEEVAIERVVPEDVGLDSRALERVATLMEGYVERGAIPGAVVAVVRDGGLAYIEAFGSRSAGVPMTIDTRFDLASLTKPIVVATSVMQLVERGQLRLSERVNSHIPDFEGWRDEDDNCHDITILDLMTHTSQLPPYVAQERLQREYPDSTALVREELIDYIVHCDRELPDKGTTSRYSCLNHIVLGAIIEQVTGMSLDDYARQNIFEPLAMNNTRYNPDASYAELCAPTSAELCGVVHDPLARELMSGVSGNAGLFSTAEDLAVYAAMLLRGGVWRDVEVLSELSVEALFTTPSGCETSGRTLGWKCADDVYDTAGDLLIGSGCIVHTGATGTSITIDKTHNLAIIILTNRTLASATATDIFDLRSKVCNVVAASCDI